MFCYSVYRRRDAFIFVTDCVGNRTFDESCSVYSAYLCPRWPVTESRSLETLWNIHAAELRSTSQLNSLIDSQMDIEPDQFAFDNFIRLTLRIIHESARKPLRNIYILLFSVDRYWARLYSILDSDCLVNNSRLLKCYIFEIVFIFHTLPF